jgi:hypothetical protein
MKYKINDMNEDYKKLLDKLLDHSKYDDFRVYEKKVGEWGDWYEKKEVEVKEIPITIEGVLRKFKPEELIEAIGIEKVETIIRAHKIKQLKKKIKK